MTKVASCSKFENKEQAFKWLRKLPKKYSLDDIENYLAILEKGHYLFWTENKGLKILK